MKHCLIILQAFLLSISAGGQSIAQLEYFFDHDPGYGQGVQVAINTDSIVDLQFDIPLDHLRDGFHRLYLRGRDSNGSWSLIQKRLIEVRRENLPSPREIDFLEVFFDEDPGRGRGLEIDFSSDTTVSLQEAIVLTGLSPGIHRMYVRSRDVQGVWSMLQYRTFEVIRSTELPENQIVYAEYFFDRDPGLGMGHEISFDPDSIINKELSMPIGNLPKGIHRLYLRAQDNYDAWSTVAKRLVDIKSTDAPDTPFIKAVELILNIANPENNKINKPIIPDTSIDDTLYLGSDPIEAGVFIIYLRAVDNRGKRGHLHLMDTFEILECEIVTTPQDTGFGSFRHAVQCVNEGDTVFFDPSVFGQTIEIDQPIPLINKSFVIWADSGSDITLSNADADNTETLIDCTGRLQVFGVDIVGKSGESFIIRFKDGGTFEFIDGSLDKLSLEVE